MDIFWNSPFWVWGCKSRVVRSLGLPSWAFWLVQGAFGFFGGLCCGLSGDFVLLWPVVSVLRQVFWIVSSGPGTECAPVLNVSNLG